MNHILRFVLPALTAGSLLFVSGCGAQSDPQPPPTGPTPAVTATAYILPNAVSLGDRAFGDEPVSISAGERLRWVNADSDIHRIVADSPGVTDFGQTNDLRPGGEQSFTMTRPGTTRIHCTIHPNMTGTLIVREP